MTAGSTCNNNVVITVWSIVDQSMQLVSQFHGAGEVEEGGEPRNEDHVIAIALQSDWIIT